MAKVEMQFLEIAASLSDSKALIDFLQKRSVMEIREVDDAQELVPFDTSQLISSISKYRDTAQTAMQILDRYSKEKSGLLSSLNGLPVLSREEYEKKEDEVDSVLSVCRDIVNAEKTINENTAQIARCKAGMEAVKPWIGLDVPMQFKGTDTTSAFIGTLPAEYTADSLAIALAGQSEEELVYDCEIVSHDKDRSCVFVLSHRKCEEQVLKALRAIGFAYPSDPTKHPPRVRYDRLSAEIEQAEKEITMQQNKIKEFSACRDDIKFAYDWFTVRMEKYEALEKVCVGDSVIVLNGYVPKSQAQATADEIEAKFCAATSVRDVTQDDVDVPTAFKNRPFAAAVEPITEMYSMPGGEDPDPNPVMCFFYYMLFGIMLSDAGYGLLMAIGCGIAKFKFKVTGKLKKTVDMYFWCGLATVFWGALFGSWFGDIIPRVAKEFFDKDIGSIAIWFEPVNDPMKLMLYSFLFGIIHLFFGLGLSFYKMWKAGNRIGAVFDCIPVALLVAGAAPLGAGIIIDVDPTIRTVAKYLALAGAALIVLTAGRNSKNIVGKLGLGLYGLYNTASGWLSDILSYSRLLALGLCTGVIATVVNTLGCIPSNKAVKAIMLVFVFLFGHTVNMAINLIGTYVHTNRLQYVEFFSKFYEGGGKTFTPLKATTKYYQVKED